MNTRPNFEVNADTALMKQHLLTIPVGTDVTYADLAKLIGRSSLDGSNPQLQSALRKCQREGVYFDNIRGVGYRRMNDAEIVTASGRDVRKVNRASKRYMKRLGTVDYDRLSQQDRTAFNTNATLLGMMAEMSSSKTRKVIGAKVESAQARLPITQTIEHFLNGKSA